VERQVFNTIIDPTIPPAIVYSLQAHSHKHIDEALMLKVNG